MHTTHTSTEYGTFNFSALEHEKRLFNLLDDISCLVTGQHSLHALESEKVLNANSLCAYVQISKYTSNLLNVAWHVSAVLCKSVLPVLHASGKLNGQLGMITATDLHNKKAERQINQGYLLAAVLGSALMVAVGSFVAILVQRHKRLLLREKIALAGEIHDELGPMIYYCRMLVKDELRQNKDVHSANLVELQKYLYQTGETIRDLATELRRDGTCNLKDLRKHVVDMLVKYKTVQNTAFFVSTVSQNARLSIFQFTQIKLSLQEAIHNSFKHAPESPIHIEIKCFNDEVSVQYWDEGPGFKPDYEAGNGLKSMIDRMERINGVAKFQNNYPEGYKIFLNLPV